MYSIIIRGNIDSDDVEISENSNEKFQEKIEKLISSIPIKLIPNNNNHFYTYMYNVHVREAFIKKKSVKFFTV